LLCPACHSESCRRSRRGGMKDRLASVFGLRPWRCRTCGRRFHAGVVAIRFGLYVHCPSCGNLDLQKVSRDRVVEGRLLGLRRMLRFPAYRCEDCRSRFFSLRKFRPVKPRESHRDETEQAPATGEQDVTPIED